MSNGSNTTIRAIFETREAADLAVEHLIQKHGIPRPDIFIQAAHDAKTTGSLPSGGDIAPTGSARDDAPLEGEIEVSVDVAAEQMAAIQRTMGEIGAMRVSVR